MMIFDGHAYCWPPLTGRAGFATEAQLQRHLQLAMANHFQPVWRARDRAPGDNSSLIDPTRGTRLDALKDVGFHAAEHGRFEWTVDGERYVKQYFPPSIADMSYSPESLVAEMDYAGVDKALLHRTPYVGIGNEFTAECVRRVPDRLLGLAHTPEWLVGDEPDASIARVEHAVRELGLSGLQFLPGQLRGFGDTESWDRESFRPFWDGVARLGVPIFFSFGSTTPPDATGPENHFLASLKTLLGWMERYPDTKVVITHGLAWPTFIGDDRIDLPEEVWVPFENPNAHLQLLFPIGLGGVWDYPMPQVRPAIEECVRRIGADRLIWGTDMPIVLRFWTYRQNIDFIRRYCDFLSPQELAQILGGTVDRLLTGG